MWKWSNALLSLDYFIFTTIVITFLTAFILTHPAVNFPCRRKPEHPEKTHDFRQSVDSLFTWGVGENRTHDRRRLPMTKPQNTENCVEKPGASRIINVFLVY